MDLRNQKYISHKIAEKLRMGIFELYRTHISKWKHKLHFLCNNSK